MTWDTRMEAAHITSTARKSVRWPFRIFAALILLLAVVAPMGYGYIAWSEGRAMLAWQLLASLPAAAWFIRFNWHAAIHGRSPATEHWPFASQRVLSCYMLAWMFMLLCPFGA